MVTRIGRLPCGRPFEAIRKPASVACSSVAAVLVTIALFLPIQPFIRIRSNASRREASVRAGGGGAGMVASGRYHTAGPLGLAPQVFGDEPDGTQFCDLATIVRQNASFQRKSKADLAEEVFGSDRGLG